MALGTSITAVSLAGEGSAHQVFAQQLTLAADGAYSSGGTKLTKHLRTYLSTYGAREVVHADGWGTLAGAYYFFKYDAVNDKLLAIVAASGIESVTADMSAMTMNLTVWSK